MRKLRYRLKGFFQIRKNSLFFEPDSSGDGKIPYGSLYPLLKQLFDFALLSMLIFFTETLFLWLSGQPYPLIYLCLFDLSQNALQACLVTGSGILVFLRVSPNFDFSLFLVGSHHAKDFGDHDVCSKHTAAIQIAFLSFRSTYSAPYK